MSASRSLAAVSQITLAGMPNGSNNATLDLKLFEILFVTAIPSRIIRINVEIAITG